ncbi:troponin C-akin-1 protein-like [Teleopsis dalmanni]|uniref:troponin C-akin-1 protein-like n=1 Tax=Teleopsis dalmanni TaxID=139649 RepID=UPI0018CC98E7|nr:troponin C-akin-1 protein-like [Teleopsis dalmanni]XP_037955532.1 troponin C-akin-1 protein-like [Teleopsis dalmanni]
MCNIRNASSALQKLFVFGALKYGQPSHSILASSGNGYAKFWCRATTAEKLPLVIATRYNIPFLLNKPGVGYYVTGEIYEVDNKMLDSLDSLEDCQDIFTREMHDMNIGVGEGTVPCWVYLLHKYPEKLLSLPYLARYENTPAQPYVLRNRRSHKHPAQEDLSYTDTASV